MRRRLTPCISAIYINASRLLEHLDESALSSLPSQKPACARRLLIDAPRVEEEGGNANLICKEASMSPPPTIFLGGSRSITRLHPAIADRISRVVAGGYRILLGDADGVDSALQCLLAETGYRDVTVFCSGERPRKYHGPWDIRRVHAPFCARGYEFHAVKDRAMADTADLGLMIWDGASPGSALNALRLTGQRKPAFVFDSRSGTTIRLDTVCDWTQYIGRYPARLRASLRTRATAAEWAMIRAQS